MTGPSLSLNQERGESCYTEVQVTFLFNFSFQLGSGDGGGRVRLRGRGGDPPLRLPGG